jgi:hypothetical protein
MHIMGRLNVLLAARGSILVMLCSNKINLYTTVHMNRAAQSVQWLATDWATRPLSPTEAEDVSSTLCVQTGSGAHPASCTMGTGALSPGAKCGRGVMLTTHPFLVLRLRKRGFLPPRPPRAFHGV